MSVIWLTIVTENQNRIEQAKALATILAEDLRFMKVVNIERYTKFPNSFKIELETDDINSNNLKTLCKQTGEKITQPWTLYSDSGTNDLEMIFNKTANSQFTSKAYRAIRWANLGIKRSN